MQSKTSYFNKTVFLKTVTRFWPLWFIYTAVWLIVLPFNIGNMISRPYYEFSPGLYRDILDVALYGGVFIGAVSAVFSAMAIWSFLYNTRSAHGTACLPIKREGIFVSVSLAGILPLLASNILVFIVTAIVEAVNGCLHLPSLLSWLGIVTLILVFFYGFAIFCAQLTGNIVVLPIVYAVLNFTVIVVTTILNSLTSTFVYGMSGSNGLTLSFLSPVVEMLRTCGYQRIENTEGVAIDYIFEGWLTISVYAVAGLVFLAFALLLYRRRRMESAGDVVAVNFLKPVFKYCLTGGCALVIGILLYYITASYDNGSRTGFDGVLPILFFMLIGSFIGYFSAQMLTKKSFKVWKSGWPGFGISAAVIIFLMCSMELNLFGYETYVPNADKVTSVVIQSNGEVLSFENNDNINEAINIHKSIINNKHYYEQDRKDNYLAWDDHYNTNSVTFSYVLDKRIVERRYVLHYYQDRPETYGDTLSLQTLMNTPEAIIERKETAFELTESNIIGASITATLSASDCARLNGYNDVETFVLNYYAGMSDEEINSLSAEDRKSITFDYAMKHAVNIGEFNEFIEKFGYDMAYEYYAEISAPSSAEIESIDISDLSLKDIFFEYTWDFTPDEIIDLYGNCILPDMEDGTIGKLWMIDDENFRNSVYSAQISIDARMPYTNTKPDGTKVTEYSYEYFHTTPTVDSLRTNSWLRAHGIELHTIAQIAE